MKITYSTLLLTAALAACAAPKAPQPAPEALPAPAAVPVPPVPPEDHAVALHVLAQAGVEPPKPHKGHDMLLSRSRGARTLIIQTSDADPGTYANLEEDLNVMYRILTRTRKQDEDGFRLAPFFSGSGSSVKSMYVEGYGAIFMLNVRFPLVAPQGPPSEVKAKDAASAEWERARRELYARGPYEIDLEHVWEKIGPAVEEYDAQKVEDLTVSVLESLKNAAHIRNLKSDEFVTVAVLGAESAPHQTATAESEDVQETNGKVKRRTRIERSSGSGRGETTMTIRVKKSDAEDFAKDKLNLDAFRKKAKMLVYVRPGDPAGKFNVIAEPARR